MSAYRICRFQAGKDTARIGLIQDETVLDLSSADVRVLSELFEEQDIVTHLETLVQAGLKKHSLNDITLLAPVDRQDVWAAGVT
jgi:hypothetical protein